MLNYKFFVKCGLGLLTLSCLAGCFAAPNRDQRPSFVEARDQLTSTKRVALLTDGCLFRSVLGDASHFAIKESVEMGDALRSQVEYILKQEGVTITASGQPFACGSLLNSEFIKLRFADQIDGTTFKPPTWPVANPNAEPLVYEWPDNQKKASSKQEQSKQEQGKEPAKASIADNKATNKNEKVVAKSATKTAASSNKASESSPASPATPATPASNVDLAATAAITMPVVVAETAGSRIPFALAIIGAPLDIVEGQQLQNAQKRKTLLPEQAKRLQAALGSRYVLYAFRIDKSLSKGIRNAKAADEMVLNIPCIVLGSQSSEICAGSVRPMYGAGLVDLEEQRLVWLDWYLDREKFDDLIYGLVDEY